MREATNQGAMLCAVAVGSAALRVSKENALVKKVIPHISLGTPPALLREQSEPWESEKRGVVGGGKQWNALMDRCDVQHFSPFFSRNYVGGFFFNNIESTFGAFFSMFINNILKSHHGSEENLGSKHFVMSFITMLGLK